MKLGEFIKQFVERNTLVRLVYQNKGGHEIVQEEWNDVSMEHEILNGYGKNRHYIDNEVVGVTDIMTGGAYPEAVNIVIEKLENQPQIKETIRNFNNNTEWIAMTN